RPGTACLGHRRCRCRRHPAHHPGSLRGLRPTVEAGRGSHSPGCIWVTGFRPGLHPAAVAPAGRPPPPQFQPGATGQARPGYGHSRVCSHAHHPVLWHHYDHRSGGQHRHGHPADGVVQRPQRAHPAPAAAGAAGPCTGRGAAAPPVAAAAGDHGADAHSN
ncbi:hypothetical protein HaLaN_10932, partial [Haematococcus lacustris]